LVITHRQYGQKSYTKIVFFKQLKRAGLPSKHLFITTAQLYAQDLSTVLQCDITPWLRCKLNRLRAFRREPFISS